MINTNSIKSLMIMKKIKFARRWVLVTPRFGLLYVVHVEQVRVLDTAVSVVFYLVPIPFPAFFIFSVKAYNLDPYCSRERKPLVQYERSIVHHQLFIDGYHWQKVLRKSSSYCKHCPASCNQPAKQIALQHDQDCHQWGIEIHRRVNRWYYNVKRLGIYG